MVPNTMDDSLEQTLAIRTFVEAGGQTNSNDVLELVNAVHNHAHSFFPLLITDVHLPELILTRPLDSVSDLALFRQELQVQSQDVLDPSMFFKMLRQYRHRSLIRIALRESLCLADIDQTCAEVSALASAIVDTAVHYFMERLSSEKGVPTDEHGEKIPFVVLGMGKLGGNELNLGSDIDLCFFYGTDDGSVNHAESGESDWTVHQWFRELALRAVKAISEITEDGFCFRVDLRLRPEGMSGPVVNSLTSAERYYETWGRTWERAALLRAAPVGGDVEFGASFLQMLRPFIYRSEVDTGMAEQLYKLIQQNREENSTKVEQDVKIGPGGIREAEFVVQALQLTWGGKFKALQVQNTVLAIRRLKALEILTDKDAEEMEQDWALLRRVEHRIHAQLGYQTHTLPENIETKTALSASLGFLNLAAFELTLNKTRTRVHQKIKSLVSGEEEKDSVQSALQQVGHKLAQGIKADELTALFEANFPESDPEEFLSPLRRLSRFPTSPLGVISEERFPGLCTKLLHEVEESTSPKQALQFLANYFSKLGDPTPYIRMLYEDPKVMRRLVRLLGASRTFSTMLLGHPEALDHVLMFSAPTEDEIEQAHQAWGFESPQPDPEKFISFLRVQKRDFVLRIGLAYVAQELDLRQSSQLLTSLADAQIRLAYRVACQVVLNINNADVLRCVSASFPFAIVGMGKLGSFELGFGSDLDLIFLYDEVKEGLPVDIEEMPWVCTRLAQKIWQFLSQSDVEGRGYELDARLRPSGNQGSLVVSKKGFIRYHETKAENWEKQALIKARPVTGNAVLMESLASLFRDISYLSAPPDKKSMAEMRGRIQNELGKETEDRWHPKLGFGALLDIEFLVQYLQMKHGQNKQIQFRDTLDALKALVYERILKHDEAEILTDAWFFFRKVEQEIRVLDETYQPVLFTNREMAGLICRRLGFRDRDRMPARQAFLDRWKRHGTKVRGIFEQHLSSVETQAPWKNH